MGVSGFGGPDTSRSCGNCWHAAPVPPARFDALSLHAVLKSVVNIDQLGVETLKHLRDVTVYHGWETCHLMAHTHTRNSTHTDTHPLTHSHACM